MSALDPEMAEALALNARLQPPGDRDRLPWPEQRQIFEDTRRFWNEGPLEVTEVSDTRLPCGMAARRYRSGAEDSPLVAYLHGGGWTLGSLDSHDCVARALCHHGRLDVASLDYPLAPEAAFDTIVERIAAAVRDLSAEDGRPIVLAGDSAGAHLAVFVTDRLSGPDGVTIGGLVSFYGVLARSSDLPSMGEFADGRFGLSAERMALYWDALDAEADPLALTCPLPPSLVVAAGCDVLRDASIAFAKGLSARGGTVELIVEPGMAHAFMGYGKTVSRVAEVAARAGAFLRDL